MKSYSSYKDSGLGWIGEVPSHWTIPLLRHLKSSGLCEYQDGNHGSVHPKNDDFVDNGIPFLRPTDVFQNYIDKKKLKYIPIEYVKKLRIGFCKTGDLIFVNRGNIGVTSILEGFDDDEFIIINPQLTYLRFKESNYLTKYFHFLSQSNIFKSNRDLKLGNGSVLNFLGLGDLGDYVILHPPHIEQQQIVSFLDTKTQKIDELIKKTKQKIILLKEKRTSLINHCVTKGLNSDVEMKDSGVEWIGEIPSNYQMVSIKFLVTTPVTDGPHETPVFIDKGIPFLSVNGVVGNKINFNKVRGYISEELHVEYSKKCKPQRDDVLLVKSGSTTGKSTIVETDLDFNIWSPLCIIRSHTKKIIPRFTFHTFQSYYFRLLIEDNWSYGTQPNIGMNVIENLSIVVPPISEQTKIVEYLDEQTQKIDFTIEKETQRTKLLKEYRQSLISEVVTGKVDVRGLN
jgi:type I restriction enzyme, S subunit